MEKHGSLTRRGWRKLHIGVDADTGRDTTVLRTAHDANDAAQVGPLLDWLACPIASFTADDAYDQERGYAEVAT